MFPAEAMLLERWYDLDQPHAREILELFERLSDEELLERPHVLTGAAIAASMLSGSHAEGGDQAALLERYRYVRARQEILTARQNSTLAARWFVTLMIGARWEGRFDNAVLISEKLGNLTRDAGLRATVTRHIRDDLDRPGHVALQRGITALLAGSPDAAMQLFTESYRDGGDPPFRHFAKVNAAANAAMLAAIEGYPDAACAWIDRAGDPNALPGWCRDLITIGSTIASTVLATDALDLEAADKHAQHLAGAGDRFELWPYQLYALTQYDLARNEPVSAYQRFKRIGFERGINIAVEPIADHIVFRAYLDTLVAGGEGGLVIRLTKDLGSPIRSLVPVARTHLLAGNDIAAARVSARAMRRVLAPLKDMWEATIVHAIARMRLGETDAALRSFTIVTAGEPAALPSILARQRPQDVRDLFALAGLEFDSQFDHTSPAGIELIELTEREKVILQHLVDRRTIAEIATTDFTSVNTVKTHVKRIYKKLGVSNRLEAAALANQQGLVRWHHNDGIPGTET
ncbi:LuxR C-terminal-related transcriptional regulator [Leifsonia sp. H3M29-4]|uniref:helix-turn-helix transcriptional regulator n=1 Tax=Salinibacterium metalliresistens TaxID=3031321 RepID=UPI0023DC7B34|nr:LuxR C-terminal-related transcriptional regulator [Salinibacterium metalliresistens]MDF1477915.1 LuxR C-terminal-related transcriptional regulator [Salinibacterium metalliresistens]